MNKWFDQSNKSLSPIADPVTVLISPVPGLEFPSLGKENLCGKLTSKGNRVQALDVNFNL